MTYYRAIVTKTLETYLEFDDNELGDQDASEFAWEMSNELTSMGDWQIYHTDVEVEEFEGELP